MSKKHFNFKSSIRDWYIRAFPSDQLGYRINPLVTFAGTVNFIISNTNNVVFAQIANFETTNDRAYDSCVAFAATEFIL